MSEKEDESIHRKINQCICSLKVADDLTLDAKNTLKESFSSKNADCQLVQMELELVQSEKEKLRKTLKCCIPKRRKLFSG